MNGRLAKKLRRAAENEMAGKPYRMPLKKADGQIYHHPESVRGFYQKLKKVYQKKGD